ncbi:DUF4974 domain-containing protein [Puteibacter caeruleilacunae]|nr:DUF4974 domain-containing protein [Puteibacter caeruleilacunae]
MKMNETIKQTIIRYISGNSDAKDHLEILKWIKLSDENEKEFFQLKDMWDAGQLEYVDKKREELNWNKLLQRIEDKKENPRKIKLMSWKRVGIAASFLLLFFAGWLANSILPKFTSENMAMHTIVVPKGEQSQLILADGTKVWLNANTTFSYPVDFSKENRKTNLNGEAFFDVVSDRMHPFEVKTKHQKIRVFGTQFNVDAYEDAAKTVTTLIHGEVRIYDQRDREVVTLKPKEKSILSHRSHELYVTEAEFEIDAGWKDGILYFDGISFDELAGKIERWYGTKIIIKDERLKQEKFTGKFFRDQSVWQTLDLIKLMLPIEYIPGKREIEIYYKNQK